MSANILNIGSVVKHRGIYDKDTVYYKDNQVTMCGSLFQAISSNFKGVAPLAEASDGTVTLANKIFWKCVIDNTALYNSRGDGSSGGGSVNLSAYLKRSEAEALYAKKDEIASGTTIGIISGSEIDGIFVNAGIKKT